MFSYTIAPPNHMYTHIQTHTGLTIMSEWPVLSCFLFFFTLNNCSAENNENKPSVSFCLRVSANGNLLGYDEFIHRVALNLPTHTQHTHKINTNVCVPTYTDTLPCSILTLSYLLIGKADRRREGWVKTHLVINSCSKTKTHFTDQCPLSFLPV